MAKPEIWQHATGNVNNGRNDGAEKRAGMRHPFLAAVQMVKPEIAIAQTMGKSNAEFNRMAKARPHACRRAAPWAAVPDLSLAH
jgi:hypothetical protein